MCVQHLSYSGCKVQLCSSKLVEMPRYHSLDSCYWGVFVVVISDGCVVLGFRPCILCMAMFIEDTLALSTVETEREGKIVPREVIMGCSV